MKRQFVSIRNTGVIFVSKSDKKLKLVANISEKFDLKVIELVEKLSTCYLLVPNLTYYISVDNFGI